MVQYQPVLAVATRYGQATDRHFIAASRYDSSNNWLDTEFSVSTSGLAKADGGWGGAADYAEYFYTNNRQIDKGDLVSLIDEKSPTGVGSVEKASNNNKENLVGIISTKPGFIGMLGEDTTDAGDYYTLGEGKDKYRLVSMMGQAPVKVSTENGPIEVNTPITTSSIAGIGSKSTEPGYVIGRAVESFNPTSMTCIPVNSVSDINWPEDLTGTNTNKTCFKLPNGTYVGKVMVYVKVYWYHPLVSDSLNVIDELNVLQVGSSLTPTTSGTLTLGTNTKRWGDIYTQGTINLGNAIDNGGIRYNPDTKRLEFSNDGTNWIPFGSSTYTDLLPVQYPGSIVLDGTENNIGEITTGSTGVEDGSMNYYQWNSLENTLNNKEISIRYQLPSNFREWGSGGITLSFTTESTNSLENRVDLHIYKQDSNDYDAILENNISSVPEQWQTIEIEGSQLDMCNKAEDICIIKIKMSSSLDNYVRVGDIKIKYERTL
jgi:hypothetical protein